ncbi:hypothetical protein [Methylohalobius crimeensis]|uniref:hypothetical protein n=1 Tax=Methylohalobius crimeensis TaxID=244365 RepID=UPI0003B59951|nr:hypothetical protein [Methylohalobius crimeensis]
MNIQAFKVIGAALILAGSLVAGPSAADVRLGYGGYSGNTGLSIRIHSGPSRYYGYRPKHRRRHHHRPRHRYYRRHWHPPRRHFRPRRFHRGYGYPISYRPRYRRCD